MANPFLGEIRLFAGNFAPRGWLACNGQLLAISQYTALFALLGTYYGGNGTSNFALPDLRGRVPVHMGTGPAPANRAYLIGEEFGSDAPATTTVPTGFSVERGLAASVTATGNADGGASNHNRLGLYYIIATTGIFPSRN
jgi:microcystin-dependent protein